MSDFAHYLDPRIPLEQHLVSAFEELRIASEQREALIGFLAPLKVKSKQTYEHSLRVGLLARRISRFMHLDERALLYAGLMHDVGKALTPLETLHKTVGWSAEDTAAMRPHVMDSYRLLRGFFNFSAEIVVWPHRFPHDGYPQHIPAPLHEYSEGTKVQVAYYGRLFALADSYDACHRINSKFGDQKRR